MTFENCDKVHVGSTCKKLEERLQHHVTQQTSQMFKYRSYKHKIELIVKAPSKDRKTLKKVEMNISTIML